MLVDRFGREIASGKPIIEEIAVQTVRDRYSSYPSQGLTPQRLARIFKEADQGDVTRQAEMFEEMEEKDLHLGGVLQTRRLAVSGLDWEILPASDSAEDKEIAASAKEMIEYIENWDAALIDTLDAIGKGFSVQEIIWEIAEGKVWAKQLERVFQGRFTFNSPEALLKFPRLLTDDAPVWGEELIPNKFVVHMPRSRSGLPSRAGLLRPCSWAYLFKNFDIKSWLMFLELFGIPLRIGKYKPGASNEEIETLKRAVFNLGVDAAAVISESTLIEFVESKKGGSGTGGFDKFADYWDKSMSKAVLGHTGSAEGTPGKLGGEDQAKNVRQDLLEADAKALMQTIKFCLLKPWVAFNYGADRGIPKFKLHFEEDDDLETAAKVYGILVKEVNFQGIPEDHIHERFGIPKPTAGQKTVQPAAPAAPQPPVAQVANKAIIMANKTTGDEDWVKTYMDRLAPSLKSAQTVALDDIEDWLRSLAGPPSEEVFAEHIQGILGDAYKALDASAIAETVREVYGAYRAQPGIDLAFGGPDMRSINFLAKVDRFYVSKFIKNPDAQATVKQFLQERYLEQGAGLFGRGKPEDIQAFRDLFSQKLADLEDWQIRRIVDTSVQRTRNWATVAQYQAAGIAELEIYEPTKDCAFCVAMNGRKISVATAYAKMTAQSAMTPAQYERDITTIAPTVDNVDAMVGAGHLPPYHPHCHGVVIRRMA